jgi:LysM repeat protein
MITPNSYPPPGTVQVPAKRKSNLRLAVFVIVALHLVIFAGLLQQGCRQKAAETAAAGAAGTNEFGPITTPAYPETTAPAAGTGTQQIAGVAPTPGAPAPAAPAPAPAVTTPAPAATAPTPAAEGAPAAAGAAKEYVVVKGDTPAKIAKQHGIPVKALLAANPGLQPRKLQINQKLVIPAAAAAAAPSPAATIPEVAGAPAPAGPAAGETGQVHVVKRGDNLTKIAKQHGTTVKALRAANSLKTDRILVGQKLKLPAAPQKGTAEDTTSGAPADLAAANK